MHPQRICLALLLLINTYLTNAQFGECRTPSTGNGCNFIKNSVFAERPNPNYLPNITYDNNFHNGNVLDWVQAQNSPWGGVTNFASWNSIGATYLLNNTPAPPIPQATDYAILAAVARSNSYIGTDPNGNVPLTTTIFQKIKPLTAGKEYVLSFFKQLKPLTYFDSLGGLEQIKHMAKFRIVLMNCSEFVQPPTGVGVYVQPVNSEVIYEEVNLNNPNWEQVVTCFTPHANYNMIMVQPLQEDYEFNLEQGNSAARAVSFAYPQIIAKDELSINIIDADNPASCRKKLSSGCDIIPNATYSWYVNGIFFSADKEPIIDALSSNQSVELIITLPNGGCEIKIGGTVPACNLSTTFNCGESLSLNGCNYFRNYEFRAPESEINSTNYSSFTPFADNEVPFWHNATGHPYLDDQTGFYGNIYSNFINYPPLPFPVAHYAILSGGLHLPGPTTSGIIQKIPSLEPGQKYIFSLFRANNLTVGPAPHNLSTTQKLTVVLLNCADVQTLPLGITTPYPLALPDDHQIIYCEANINSPAWKQGVVSFTATKKWDMAIIYGTEQNSQNYAVQFIAYPELIKAPVINAGTNITPQAGECKVLIGSPINNTTCSIKNAIYQWRGPNNQIIPVNPLATNQQILIDVSAPNSMNIGTWTLELFVPNALANINSCIAGSNVISVIAEASITVSSCTATQMDCTPVTVTGCNLIRNNGFNAPTYNPTTNPGQIGDVFGLGLVSNWQPMHGTPDIYNNTGGIMSPLPPSGVNSYVRMAALWQSQFPSDRASEGLMQKIPALQVGREYVFSFYRRKGNSSDFAGSNDPVDFFKVSLMKCSDINFPIANTNYWPPNIPASPNHQNIYCESKVINDTWEQVVVKFSATNSWDVILIYAHPTFNGPNSNSNLLFANPELIPTPVINAGPNPTATFVPDCKTLIGADNSAICRISNGIFRWKKPDGTYITQGVSQTFPQAQVNTATEAGTWTLEYVVPNAVTNYISCNTNNPLATNIIAQATVKVELCKQSSEAWPKVYKTSHNGIETSAMAVGRRGNIFTMLNNSQPLINQNHIGALPTTTNESRFSFQYNAQGVSQWVRENLKYGSSYLFDNTNIQIGGMDPFTLIPTTRYLNGTTGVNLSTPISLVDNELIVAELGNGDKFITYNYSSIKVRIPNSISSTIDLLGIVDIKFNPTTQKLTALKARFGEPLMIYIYDLVGDQLILNNSFNAPIGMNDNRLIVNQNNQLFYYSNGILMMRLANGSSLPVMIQGFSNNDLFPVDRLYTYSSNDLLVFNRADRYLYYLDLGTLTSKKIATVNYYTSGSNYYGVFDGNIYLMGGINGTPISIGSQQINPVSTSDQSIFITKLSMQNDFQRIVNSKSNEAVNKMGNPADLKSNITTNSLLLFPNPTRGNVTITSENEIISVTIYDVLGKVQKEILGGKLKRLEFKIDGFSNGTYTCIIKTTKGIESKNIILVK